MSDYQANLSKSAEELLKVHSTDGISTQETVSVNLSFGETLVGLTFNPSGDPKVQRAKELCAELAELIKPEMNASASPLKRMLSEHTIGEILNAQMNVVKVLTFKY
jgi:hypothetical protein